MMMVTMMAVMDVPWGAVEIRGAECKMIEQVPFQKFENKTGALRQENAGLLLFSV
jgi:hypothetical protein